MSTWFDEHLKDNKLDDEGKQKLANMVVADLRAQGHLVEYTDEADDFLARDVLNNSEVLQRLKQPPHYHCWHKIKDTTNKYFVGWEMEELSQCCTCGKYRTRGVNFVIPENHGKYLPKAECDRVYGTPKEWLEYPISFGIPR